ncbi:MAG: transcription antitermination factor NusB, partial [Firmicutes bacterium]|nr:transcription antitermination factor NusB [Bacillota bacterium]
MARRQSREIALRVLFEYDLSHTPVNEALDRAENDVSLEDAEFAQELVEGALEHLAQIDEAITQASIAWKIQRMPAIDRNILRLSVFEIFYSPQVPISVIINEAVELAKTYSTDEAKKFVNGVLGTIAQMVRPEGDPP